MFENGHQQTLKVDSYIKYIERLKGVVQNEMFPCQWDLNQAPIRCAAADSALRNQLFLSFHTNRF